MLYGKTIFLEQKSPSFIFENLIKTKKHSKGVCFMGICSSFFNFHQNFASNYWKNDEIFNSTLSEAYL